EIAQDRTSLLAIMKGLDVPVRRYKVYAGWTAEKVARLKNNGRPAPDVPPQRQADGRGAEGGPHPSAPRRRPGSEAARPGEGGRLLQGGGEAVAADAARAGGRRR
ncbi:hypothetical protein E1265_27075, partial [Streptomyces sp. 8K308]